VKPEPSAPRRYLGIELSGAKNQKTALAAIEYYPREEKIFLLDIYDRVAGHDHQTGDEALLEIIGELGPGTRRVGVNVPIELPPCITCTRKTCPMPARCSVPAVKWMRDATRRAARAGARAREFTPYTQRPAELFIRYGVLPKLPEWTRLEIDEALGGNKAPLTARMHFLRCHLKSFELAEVWPKLTVALLAQDLGLHRRTVTTYRHLEQGAHARGEILEALVSRHGVFIYERDVRKLAQSLAAFDAFVCAYTALLSDLGRCVKLPRDFPPSAGWLEFPRAGARKTVPTG
jgi:hypothetical protein